MLLLVSFLKASQLRATIRVTAAPGREGGLAPALSDVIVELSLTFANSQTLGFLMSYLNFHSEQRCRESLALGIGHK